MATDLFQFPLTIENSLWQQTFPTTNQAMPHDKAWARDDSVCSCGDNTPGVRDKAQRATEVPAHETRRPWERDRVTHAVKALDRGTLSLQSYPIGR